MKYRVVLMLDVQRDVHLRSEIFTGLHLLARRGLIALRIRPATEDVDVQYLHVTPPGRDRPLRVAIDISDHSTHFFLQALDRCDVYFKRSYHPPDLKLAPAALRGKILPFGLTYSCCCTASRAAIVKNWLSGAARFFCGAPRLAASRAPTLLRHLKAYLLQPDYRLFEQDPDTPVEPRVLFQTRLWEPIKSSDNLAEVNEERAALVRALRKALGARFHGGVVPTPFARQHYPDVLQEQSHRRRDFLRMMQRCLIGVYTRGLHHSLAFKLPEYLAASMCVVSDPLRNPLPQPLVAGRHYYEFRDHDSCVAQCERLLSHPDEARAMRRENHAYYRQWVAPAEHLWNCLQAASAMA